MRKMSAANEPTRDAFLRVFRSKYLKAISQARARHKWLMHTIKPNAEPLQITLKELNESAKRASREKTQKI